MGRLTIDITEEQHKTLKAAAALDGKSIKVYALERLFPSPDEAAWEEFKLFIGKRVDEAMSRPPSKRSIIDIAEDGMQRFKAA